jgi:hypothetical protein
MDTQDKADRNTERAAVFVAVALTSIWILGVAIIFYLYPDAARQISYDQSLTALLAVGLFLPLILIWIAALLAKSLSTMRRETNALRKAIEKMDKTLDDQVVEQSETRDLWIKSQLAQITAHTKQTENQISALADKTLEGLGQTAPPRDTTALSRLSAYLLDDAQADLPLSDDQAAPIKPITIRELIKALNFPDNEKDTEGFRVLQRAFADRTTSKLLQSAQDMLTMLSEDGIFMDDLRVDKPEASAWRSFAKGVRGNEIAALGMVRDRTALTLTKTRLKNDTAFRETVHGFLTQFDTILTEFEKTAKDGELVEMGKTRSAVAFMLMGRVSGAFDAR